LILIPACNKDTITSDIQLTSRNTPNSGNQSFLNTINFDNNGNILIGSGHLQKVLEHAQIEKQREVSEYIFEHLSFNSIDSIKKNYGYPVWKLATIKYIKSDVDLNSNSNYRIVIPTTLNNELTGIIIYESIEDSISAIFYSREDIHSIVLLNTEDHLFYQTYFSAVANFQIMNYLVNGNRIQYYSSWMEIANRSIKNQRNNYRMVLYLDCNDVIYWSYDPVAYEETITVVEECKIRYMGGGGYYVGNFSKDLGSGGKGGGSNNSNETDNNPKIDKAKKLKCANEVADFMAQAEILELIENNNITDPCDPGQTAAELLEKALIGYCTSTLNDAPLNLKDAEHFLGEILEGINTIKIENSMGMCPKIKCILEKLINNPLNPNAYNSICALNNSNNYIFNFTMGNSNNTTFNLNNPNNITITIDNELCNSYDPVNIAETLLHEGTHAIIFANFAKGFDANIFNSEHWNSVITNEYGGNVHEFMTDYLLNPICEALWEFNGKRGIPGDYWGVVLNGLFQNLDNDGNFESYNCVILDWITNPIYKDEINPTGMPIESWIADMVQRYTNRIQNHPNGYGVKFDCP